MKGWRAMRAALRSFWVDVWSSHHHHQSPTVVSEFDVSDFEQRLVDTERRLQAEERRLQIMALESELPRGHEHDRD